ncbi:MAG: YDG domain-containing protein [Bacteroidales bacterium]
MKIYYLILAICFTCVKFTFSQTSIIAVCWSGDNASTTTFPFEATYKASFVSGASHNFTGLTPVNNNDYVWSNTNSAASVDPLTTPYLSFTIHTNISSVKFNRFVINALANSNATKEQLRWSIDNFATSLGEFTSNGNNHTLTSVNLSGFEPVTADTITFRIYFYNSSGNVSLKNQGGNMPIDDTPFFDGLSVASVNIYYWNYTPLIPKANAAKNITSGSFLANWNTSKLATGYTIQVSANSSFTSHIGGYDNLDVGNDTTCLVTGLNPGTNYYYRVRAYNEHGISGKSSIINVTTLKGDQEIIFAEIPVHTYGDLDFNPGASATSGLPVSYSSDDDTVASIINNAIQINTPGTVTIHADQDGNSSYNPASRVSQTLIVYRKPLTITGAIAESKEYDGNTNAAITGATLDGITGSDEIFLHNTIQGTYLSSDAGPNIPVSSTMTISGADTNKYTLIQPDLSADIIQRVLEITANEGQYKNLNESDPVFTYYITNGSLVADDILTGSLSRMAGETAGLYPLQIGTLSAGNNYNITYISNDFEIRSTSNLLKKFNPEFSVFPNPATNVISIQSKLDFKKIILTNLQGKMILEVDKIYTSAVELDIKDIPSGEYILSIINSDNKKCSVLIIKKP